MKGVISKEEKSIDLHIFRNQSIKLLWVTRPPLICHSQEDLLKADSALLARGGMESLQTVQLLQPPLCPLHLHPYSVVHIQQHSQIAD